MEEILIADIYPFDFSIKSFLDAIKLYPDATHFRVERFEKNFYDFSLALYKLQ